MCNGGCQTRSVYLLPGWRALGSIQQCLWSHVVAGRPSGAEKGPSTGELPQRDHREVFDQSTPRLGWAVTAPPAKCPNIRLTAGCS